MVRLVWRNVGLILAVLIIASVVVALAVQVVEGVTEARGRIERIEWNRGPSGGPTRGPWGRS